MSQGDIEHVPLKVVPMYVDEEAPAPVDEVQPPEIQVERKRTAIPGIASLALAVIAAVLQGVAIALATAGDYGTASILAYAAIVGSIVAFVGALVAVIANLGRRTGVAALVLAVLANPVVLLGLLGWVGGRLVG